MGRRYIILEAFLEFLQGLNPLDTAADEIGEDRNVQPDPAQQAPITINLEAPVRQNPKGNRGQNSQNVDATLEALALSRSAQTPNTNFRSSGANERRTQQRIQERKIRKRRRGGDSTVERNR